MNVVFKIFVDFFEKFGFVYKNDVGIFLSYKFGKGYIVIFFLLILYLMINFFFFEDKRIFFVGDVYGCFDELKELYDKCIYFDMEIVVVYVGDFVYKGLKILDVICFVREIGLFFVRGNYEQLILIEIFYKRRNEFVRDKWRIVYDLILEDEEFLENFFFMISIFLLNVLVVYGGLLLGVFLME